MARVLRRISLLTLVGLALLLSMEPSGVSAYGGRRGSRQDDSNTDYLAELTAEDLRITLTERGIDYPIDASRAQLAAFVRDADQRAAAAEVMKEGPNAPSVTGARLEHPVHVKVRYCVG